MSEFPSGIPSASNDNAGEGSHPTAASELAIVLHFHQPVGNFGHVFEKVADECYAPLLEMLFAFPELKTHLHFNAILLEWFDHHRPELLRHIERMVRRGSTELLTGGLYEPILAVLPEEDAIGQVRALSIELEHRFGQYPSGAWLTERVWEPRMPNPLSRAGVSYVVLDDAIFKWAGLDEHQLHGYYVSDDNGRPLALFPGAKSLRYNIPFRPAEKTLELLHGLPSNPERPPLMVYADDAEKFGEWPGTYEWVYTKGWLRDFLEKLRDDEAVATVHLSDRLKRFPPLGRVYPPTASYPEMTVWALPTPARARMERLMKGLAEDDPEDLLPLMRGGHWRGFLAKYPEANRLHKRMLRVSRRHQALEAAGTDDERLGRALRDLYRGQCNDAYWHGVFGGVYLPHLRRSVESFLIRAERALDHLEKGYFDWVDARPVDFDADGVDEVEMANPHTRVVIDRKGGRLLAWDLNAACDNWVTVMQRHEEPFHTDLLAGRVQYVDENGLPLERDGEGEEIATIHGAIRVKPGVTPADLAVDRHERVAAIGWSAPELLELDDPRGIEELARPLSGMWDVDVIDEKGMTRMSTEQEGLRLRQAYRLSTDGASLTVEVEIEPAEGPRRFLSEWNLLMGWTGDDLEIEEGGEFILRPQGSLENCHALRFRGGGDRTLSVTIDPPAHVHWAPVHTVSSSEAGLEKIGQGSCILFDWLIDTPRDLRLVLEPSAPDLKDEAIDG